MSPNVYVHSLCVCVYVLQEKLHIRGQSNFPSSFVSPEQIINSNVPIHSFTVCMCVPVLQEKLPIRGQPECLLELTGQDLIGLPIKAPNASAYDIVYCLPLLTILTNKGTG